MAFKLSSLSLSRLEKVHPKLVEVIKEGIVNSPYDFTITQGVRTAEYQHELYSQGRTTPGKKVTNCDGYKFKSNHQAKSDGYGYAVDLAIYNPNVPGKLEWDALKLKMVFNHLKTIADKKGIVIEWGGNWKSFKDYPHVELKK